MTAENTGKKKGFLGLFRSEKKNPDDCCCNMKIVPKEEDVKGGCCNIKIVPNESEEEIDRSSCYENKDCC